MNCTIDYVKNWLLSNLSCERYEHSIGTAECARMLAEKFNIDKDKAYFAGLIHDCAKCLNKEDILKIINEIELNSEEINSPKTHHAPCGAYLAKKEFGVCDDEVLSAIRWHTIGKCNMTTFEKIIFLADKMEERTRPKEIYEPLKNAVYNFPNGLDRALFMCYKNTIKSLADRELRICTQTVETYNNLLKQLGEMF